ncbi:MAG: dTDP-4-dehydrorhamnose reductase [Candidatus Eisenbacteria bacterium]|nr:dTDP-4-dehydrorhamnose reductase [Candidatus Eisenbacteria bacterium]
MKILITGGRGLLGTALVRRLSAAHDVTATDQEDLDVADFEAVRAGAGALRPQLIIHCAAWTQVDACESDPERAFRVNGWGARNVASAALKTGAALYFISTDYVFDGERREPYREHDERRPLNVYGRSKAFGEDAVAQVLPRHAIVRTSGLFGHGGRCFPGRILEASREGQTLDVVADQTLAPTYAPHLADALARMIGSDCYGTFHITSGGSTDWYGYAREVLSRAGRDPGRVRPTGTEESGRPAARPRYSVLDTANFRTTFDWELPSWTAGLRDYLEALKGE